MAVLDNAEWHAEGDFPADLDPFQACVHPGLFLGWLIARDRISEEFADDFADEVAAFRARALTGPALFDRIDGVLESGMLNAEARRFARHYYPQRYLKDYEATLAAGLPSTYHVADTWENFDRWAGVLDRRFDAWKAKRAES